MVPHAEWQGSGYHHDRYASALSWTRTNASKLIVSGLDAVRR